MAPRARWGDAVILYRLARIDSGYDDVGGFVVAAPDEPSARAVPAAEGACGGECRGHRERGGDVRPCVWQSESAATCERLGAADDGWTACVILRSVREEWTR